MSDPATLYSRMMLRSTFQSMFWNVLLARKRETKFTLKALADKLGINKSYISRSFTNPPNWQIDKMSDMAEALGVELIVQARDRVNGVIYTPTGIISPSAVTSNGDPVRIPPPSAEATGQFSEDGRKLLRVVEA